MQHLFTTHEAAEYVGRSYFSLISWRNNAHHKHFIPFVKIGRTIRYRLCDLEEFLSE